jgi:hypothetical protein
MMAFESRTMPIDFATQQARIRLDAAISNVRHVQNGEISMTQLIRKLNELYLALRDPRLVAPHRGRDARRHPPTTVEIIKEKESVSLTRIARLLPWSFHGTRAGPF